MEITKIKMEYVNGKSVKARCTITFNNCLTIKNIVVIINPTNGEPIVAFPSTRVDVNKVRDLAHPVTTEFKNIIVQKVLELFNSKEEEYVNDAIEEKCMVTNCRAKLLDANEGIFEADILLNNVFVVNKIQCQIKDNLISFKHPYFKTIDEMQIPLITFDTYDLRKDITDSLSKVYMKIKIKTPEERRKISNERIKKLGIACNETLSTIQYGPNVKIKDLDGICKRAIAALISTQIACDINNDNYQESLEVFSKKLELYEGVKESLNDKERRLFDGTYSSQDVIDIEWEYETYWAIVWALGLINNDISDASNICDCMKAIYLVSTSRNLEDFKAKCRVRSVEEILDILDLYYRYHWAVVENSINPESPIANLNPSVVSERRRGLEWIISDKKDWYDILLDT